MRILNKHVLRLVIGIVAMILAVVFGSVFDGDTGGLDYYADDRIGDTNNLLVSLLVPIFAGLLTWDVGILCKSGTLRGDAVVSSWRIIFSAARPSLVVALALFVMHQLVWVGMPPITVRGLLAMLLPYAVLISVFMFWSAIALRLPSAIAVPLAVIATWLAIVYPSSLGSGWTRHMTGTLAGCCVANEAISLRAVVATLLVACAIALLAVALSTTHAVLAVALAIFPIIALFLIGIRLVEPLGWRSVSPRDHEELVCKTEGDLTVCVWPEHQMLHAEALNEARSIKDTLAQVGVRLPATLTELANVTEWQYSNGLDPFTSGALHDVHRWDYLLHPNYAASAEIIRARTLDAIIPRPICESRDRRSSKAARSVQQLAPLARAIVWRLAGHHPDLHLDLDDEQRIAVQRIMSAQTFSAGSYIDASIEAILGCHEVDIDDPAAKLANSATM